MSKGPLAGSGACNPTLLRPPCAFLERADRLRPSFVTLVLSARAEYDANADFHKKLAINVACQTGR